MNVQGPWPDPPESISLCPGKQCVFYVVGNDEVEKIQCGVTSVPGDFPITSLAYRFGNENSELRSKQSEWCVKIRGISERTSIRRLVVNASSLARRKQDAGSPKSWPPVIAGSRLATCRRPRLGFGDTSSVGRRRTTVVRIAGAARRAGQPCVTTSFESRLKHASHPSPIASCTGCLPRARSKQ
jgi:hypothetical protein